MWRQERDSWCICILAQLYYCVEAGGRRVMGGAVRPCTAAADAARQYLVTGNVLGTCWAYVLPIE